jgi:putative adhesin
MKNSLFTLIFCFSAGLVIGQKQNSFNLNKSYPLDNNGTIYLDTDDAEVTIIGEDRQDVAVKIDHFVKNKGLEWGSREFRVDVEHREGDLYINEYEKNSTAVMGYVSTDYKIVIRAPYGSNLDIKGDDDEYQFSDINGEITVKADDGNVTLKNCQGNRFFFDLDDGDVTMDQGKGQLTARMDDGDINVINATFQSIDYRGDDGKVAIETSIGPSAIFKFSGDDTTFDLVITRGGGTFTINHDDGKIDYDNNFRLMDKSGDRTVLSLTGGRGKIIISGDDIRVNLATTQSN